MRRISAGILAGALVLVPIWAGPVAAAPAKAAGHMVVVQAFPGSAVEVSIDGKSVRSDVEVGSVVGPIDLAAGSHEVAFADSDGEVAAATLDVVSGRSVDVVLHSPAEVEGDPVVSSYDAPEGAIGKDKARVLVAHTATVPPADVRVNGEVAFTNIANGEFAEADLPAGTHKVELLPTGETKDPILGPLEVTLEPRTLTMVYAYGTPTDESMNLVAHTATLAADGSLEPSTIDTGSAGLAADASVTPFPAPGAGDSDAPALNWWGLGALLGIAGLGGAAWLRRADAKAKAR